MEIFLLPSNTLLLWCWWQMLIPNFITQYGCAADAASVWQTLPLTLWKVFSGIWKKKLISECNWQHRQQQNFNEIHKNVESDRWCYVMCCTESDEVLRDSPRIENSSQSIFCDRDSLNVLHKYISYLCTPCTVHINPSSFLTDLLQSSCLKLWNMFLHL